MDCCAPERLDDNFAADRNIVLVGNPNVGKSIFFNYLTGLYVSVSNYPGTTLDISSGKFENDAVFDTPGVYGVGSLNDEERVARDFILSADIVVNVIDASHLERDLFLTQQLIDLGKPVLVALNMMDEVKRNNIEIDINKLEDQLGVPVIPTVASKGEGLSEIKASLGLATNGNSIFSKYPDLKEKLFIVTEKTRNRADALLLLEEDENEIAEYGNIAVGAREEIYIKRRQRVDEIVNETVHYNQSKSLFKNKLSSWMVKPITGIPLLGLLLYIIYKFIGVFVAQTVVYWTEEWFFLDRYEPIIRALISNSVGLNNFFGEILGGEFGILTMAVTYTFGLLLPLVAGFYLLLAILEDSGYLPRIAVLVDRFLQKLGLNGRAIIPMLLGFGCVTMATITTRLLGTKRERIIAIFLLGLAIPCSAQLGVIAGLIVPLGYKYILIYVLTIFIVYVAAGTFLNKVLPGESSDLLLDLPPLRLPDPRNVLKKTYQQSVAFIKEAGPIFVLGAILITLMKQTGLLTMISEFARPLTTGWLGLPAEAATAFVMGIIRRDFGAAGLSTMVLTAGQTTIALITLTLFVPCIAAMMIMVKERNLKESIMIWFGSWGAAFLTGGIVNIFLN